MKDYFKTLGLNSNLSREELVEVLHNELRTWTNRTSNPIKEKRDKAEFMVKEVSEAIGIFESEEAYNSYLNELRAANQPQPKPQPQPQPQPKPQPQANTITVDQALDKAQALFGYDDRAALDYINRAINTSPRYPRSWYILALYYKRNNNISKAIELFRKVFTFVPNDYIAAYNLFLIYCDAFNVSEGEAMYNIIYPPIKDKSDAYAHFINAKYNLLIGNYDDAISHFKEAYKVIGSKDTISTELTVDPKLFGPGNINLKNDIANAYYEKGRLYTFGTNDTEYLTTKKDVLDFVDAMQGALNTKEDGLYKEKIQNAKALLKKRGKNWFKGLILFLIDLYLAYILYLSFRPQHLLKVKGFTKFMIAILSNDYAKLAVLVFIVLTLFRSGTRGYLYNGARLAGKSVSKWKFRSRLFGERRPKVQ